MIARLVGKLVARDGHRGVVDVHGVGYAVHAPVRDLDAWAASAEPVVVHVSTEVREDAITLYGFGTEVDRTAFDRLRGVDGVGPKIALAALDTLGLDGLSRAVAARDLVALARIPGVGKKLAQRLALELEGKLPATFAPEPAAVAPPARPRREGDEQFELALARLGYTRSEIVRAFAALEGEGLADAPVADRVRAALRALSGATRQEAR